MLVRHGLLAVDVFAGVDAIENDAAMLEVGDCNDDGVNVFAIEQLAVVAGSGDVGTPGLDSGFAMQVTEVGCSDADSIGKFALGAKQIAAANACADGSEANLSVAWRGENGGLKKK